MYTNIHTSTSHLPTPALQPWFKCFCCYLQTNESTTTRPAEATEGMLILVSVYINVELSWMSME